MKDITILYQGGSGGFALYYYLLLSGQYQYTVDSVQDMINEQFPNKLATDPSNWKDKEFWPDNIALKNTNGSKVFLICNPLFNPDCYQMNQDVSNNTYKILLYTDLHLQLRLAYEKKAYWFTNVSKQYFNAPINTKEYLRKIINSGKIYKNTLVDPMLLDTIDKFTPSQIVRLENLILTSKLLNFPKSTQHQINFLKYWYTLQPSRAQRLLSRS